MAANNPAAVVINASAIPGATARKLAEPASPSPANASITPHTVQNNPMNGETEPVVASHDIHFSSLRTSSPAATCICTPTAFAFFTRGALETAVPPSATPGAT